MGKKTCPHIPAVPEGSATEHRPSNLQTLSRRHKGRTLLWIQKRVRT
jgi:hypothetical protein